MCVSLCWVGKVGNYAVAFAVALTHMCQCVHTHTHGFRDGSYMKC